MRRWVIITGIVLAVALGLSAAILWDAKDDLRSEAQQAQDCPLDPPTSTPWPVQPTYTPQPVPVALTCTPVPSTPTPTNTPTATPTCPATATSAPPEPSPTPYSTHTPHPTLACIIPGTPSPSPTPTHTPTATATPTVTPTPVPGEAKHLAPCAGEGDGSAGNPWCTFAKAAVSTVPGDTVFVHDGTYPIGGGVSIFNNGVEGQPITFRAVNSGQAILLKSGNGSAMLDFRGNSHIILENLVINGDYDVNGWTAWRGIHFELSHDITFRGVIIRNLDGRAVYSSGNSQDILFENCTVNLGWYADGSSHDGFLIYGANARISVVGCLVYEIDHVGINFYGCEDCAIVGNEVHTTGSHLVQVGSPEGTKGTPLSVEVRDNLLYKSETFGTGSSSYHNGIYITSGDVQTVTVALNVIYDLDGSGVHIGNQMVGPIVVYNNTIYGANRQGNRDRAGIFAYSENSPEIAIYNNIVVSTRPEGLTFRVSGGANNNLTADYNLYYSLPGATTTIYRNGTYYYIYPEYEASGLEPNSLIGIDPQFVAPEDGDFRLQGTSPAIGAGFPAGVNIGAHQTE